LKEHTISALLSSTGDRGKQRKNSKSTESCKYAENERM